MIHAYCITERTPTAPPERRGLGGARLRAAEAGGLRVVYSRHRTLQFDPSPALVLTHERVVEAVMAEAPVLPLRYGTVLADVEQLRTAIGQRSGEFRRALERVRGHVELGVRLVRASGTPRPGARAGEVSGREFLLARADEQRRAEEAARAVHAPLAELATASTLRDRPEPPAVMVAAYLVDGRRTAEFRARAAALAADRDNLTLVLTGPWPPYNFVEEETE